MTTDSSFDINEFVDCARYGELDEMLSMLSTYISQHLPALLPSFQKDQETFLTLHPTPSQQEQEDASMDNTSKNFTFSSEVAEPNPDSENSALPPTQSAKPLPTIEKSDSLELSQLLRPLLIAKSDSGFTPLHVASANNELHIVLYLLRHMQLPQDLHIGTATDNSTALHWASLNGRLEIVRIFLSLGADATMKNEDGRSAVTVAEQQGHLEIVNALLATFEPGEEEESAPASSAAAGSMDVDGAALGVANISIETEIVEQ
jgi:hypothetical protein